MKKLWDRLRNVYKSTDAPVSSSVDYKIGDTQVIKVKPTRIEKVVIPVSVMAITQNTLLAAGQKKREGLLFWSGVIAEGNVAYIKRAIIPSKTRASAVHATISQGALHEIHLDLKRHNEFLLAQIHSHPGEAFHSDTDDENAVSFKKGFFSIVVPYFGNVRFEDLSQCEVFEYAGSMIWVQLSSKERMERFIIR